jgi:hypothetical protein
MNVLDLCHVLLLFFCSIIHQLIGIFIPLDRLILMFSPDIHLVRGQHIIESGMYCKRKKGVVNIPFIKHGIVLAVR